MSKRKIMVDRKEWNYIVGREFVKFNAPDGKTSAVKKHDIRAEVRPVIPHNCDHHMDEIGPNYNFDCRICYSAESITPADIKKYIESKLIGQS